MGNTMVHARLSPSPLVLPLWKSALSGGAAFVLALLFLAAGIWKLTEPYEWASKVNQLKVPAQFGLITAITLGIAEVFGGVLLIVPRFRRWGAIVTGALLIAFMFYIGFHYNALRGEDCSCFPWLKRTVGPGFFIGDAAMLLMALAAGWWGSRAESRRAAIITFAAICVFALASFGITYARQTGAKAPEIITVGGQSYSLQAGRQLIYFFDPECTHCLDAGKKLAAMHWASDVTIIGVPTVNPQFAPTFLEDTGLKGHAKISNDLEKLRQAFPFTNGPFAVALENGRQKEALRQFEAGEPEASLRKLHFVD